MTANQAPFTMVLPPGWVRIPVDADTDAVFSAMIDGVVERVVFPMPKGLASGHKTPETGSRHGD